MNRITGKGIVLSGVFFCLLSVMGTRSYGQVDQVDDINLTGFPTDEILLGGEAQKVESLSVEKLSLKGKTDNVLPKRLKDLSVKGKMAERELTGNLHQMQRMSQYPGVDISGQMKKMRALQWTGRGLWIAGGLMMTTGIILASSWFWPEEYLAPLALGVVFIGAGVPVDVVYTKRIKILKSKANYSASLDFGGQNHGVGVGLHF